MKPVRHISVLLWALLCAGASQAQESSSALPPDAQLWMSASTQLTPFRKADDSAQGRFAKKFTTTGEMGLRYNEHFNRLKQFNLDAEARYPINAVMQVAARYRYSFRGPDSRDRGRLNARLLLRWKTGRFTTAYRGQYQHTFISAEKYRTLLRNRLKLQYNIPGWKLDPAFDAESFTALHYSGNSLVGMRYTLGTSFKIGKQKDKEMEIGLRYDQQLNQKMAQDSWILVLAFEHEFKKK